MLCEYPTLYFLLAPFFVSPASPKVIPPCPSQQINGARAAQQGALCRRGSWRLPSPTRSSRGRACVGRHHSPSSPAGNHVGEGGLWHLGDALRSRRVDLDGGGRARGAVAGRRQPPSASRRPFAKAGGVIGCCSQASADKDMNNIPAQAVVRRPGGRRRCAISTHSRHRCTCVLPLPPNSAPLSSTRAHPIICSQADCGVCCANADPPDAGQSMIMMPLSGPGGRSTAREAASLPFATLATTA